MILSLILSSFLYLNTQNINFYEANIIDKMNVDISQENNLQLEDNMRLDILQNTEYIGEYTRIINQKILSDKKNIYLFGSSTKLRDELNRSSMDAIIIKYNKDKCIDKIVKLTGENYDSFNGAIILNDYLYVIGKTKSMHGDYQGYVNTTNYDTATICKYDLDLNLIKMSSIKHFLDSDFVSIESHNGKIYVLCNNKKQKSAKLLIYDQTLTLYKEITLDEEAVTLYDMYIDDKIYLCGFSINKKEKIYRQSAFIQVLDFNLETIKKKYYIGSDISAFYKMEKIDEKLYLFGALALKDKTDFNKNVKGLIGIYTNDELKCKEAYKAIFLGGYKLNDDLVIYGGIVGKSKEYEENFIPTYIYFNKELIPKRHFELSTKGSGCFLSHIKNEKEVLLSYNNLYKYNDGNYVSSNILSIKNLILNEETLTYQESSLTYQKKNYLEAFDKNHYGKYYQYDLFYNDYVNVYKNFKELTVPLIKNTNSVLYKEKLILNSNASMYCNGVHVENGYVISDPGVYKIEYYGVNDLYEYDILELYLEDVKEEVVIVEKPKENNDKDKGVIIEKPNDDNSTDIPPAIYNETPKESQTKESITLPEKETISQKGIFSYLENQEVFVLVFILIFSLIFMIVNLLG